MGEQNAQHREKDELLELLWHLDECHDLTLESLREHDKERRFESALEQFSTNGVLRYNGEAIELTDDGRKAATGIVRRHRLAERLLVDVLGKSVEETETAACEFEHILAPELVKSICILLGHPKLCPHGSPIPPGDCCREEIHSVSSLISHLNDMELGQVAKIASLNTESQSRITKLLSLGISPGSFIKLQQRSPTLVVEVNRTQIAIEPDIGNDIHVWLHNAD